MNSSVILKELMSLLPSLPKYHSPGGELQPFLKKVARREIESMFSSPKAGPVDFVPFGKLWFPYHKMGAVDTLNLFDIDELIIFSFYWANRRHYKKVVDIGANLGLHSILLSRCGYTVRSFEPDPWHFKILTKNLGMNKCFNVTPYNAAVSRESGTLEFIRVLGNTTGSHLAGAKSKPYGKLEKFPVKVEAFPALVSWADLVKIDAEGHEKEILLSTEKKHWRKTDAMVEIQNAENAKAVFKHFNKLGVNLFSQKINWGMVKELKDMPVGYKEGSLFISSKSKMDWVRDNHI